MDEQGTEGDVPTFADPEQPWLAACSMLPRHQPHPRSKLAPMLERARIADRCDQGRRRQWTNPGDRHEALAHRMGGTDCLDRLSRIREPFLQNAKLLIELPTVWSLTVYPRLAKAPTIRS